MYFGQHFPETEAVQQVQGLSRKGPVNSGTGSTERQQIEEKHSDRFSTSVQRHESVRSSAAIPQAGSGHRDINLRRTALPLEHNPRADWTCVGEKKKEEAGSLPVFRTGTAYNSEVQKREDE